MNRVHLTLTNQVDSLCARHDRMAERLDLVGRADFERALVTRRRFQHLRNLMRLRLFVARRSPPSSPPATRDGALAGWPAPLRASELFELLARGSRPA